MRNDAIKIWFQTGRSLHCSKAWTNLCSAELKSLLHSFSFELQFLPQHRTPGQQLHKEGYLTGKGVTPTSHLSSCWDYQTHRGFWSVQYLPWIISPSSLFWQYKRKASSSSIWDEMVQGSPNKKKKQHTGKFTTEEFSVEFPLAKNVPASSIAFLDTKLAFWSKPKWNNTIIPSNFIKIE